MVTLSFRIRDFSIIYTNIIFVTVYPIARILCISPFQGFPHPNPKEEGINYYSFIFSRAYALGYTHAAPLALEGFTANR